MLNEARFSLVRRDFGLPGERSDQSDGAITGAFTIGGPTNFPQSRISNAYQFSDTMTWTLTKHTLKFGADIRYNDVDNLAAFNSKGSFNFDNLQAYMNNIASRVQQALQTASWIATQWQSYFFAQDDFRVTPALTSTSGLRYEISDVPLGLFGATDPESLGALVPGPVKKDTNNWAPRVGFAWNPQTNNRWFGNSETVIRGGFGIAYDVLFYNLLIVNASNYPRIVTLDVTNQQNLYPTLLDGQRDAYLQPAAAYTNSAEDTESPESRFYSLTMQRAFGNYTFEVGYSGSRGYKGINQIEMNPAILTAEQAAAVGRRAEQNVIPSVNAGVYSRQFGNRVTIPATVGPGGNDLEARSEYNAIFFSGNKRFSDGAAIRRLVHLQPLVQQQRRVARRGRHGRFEPAPAEHVRLRGRVEPFAVRSAAPLHGELHLRDPRPARGVDGSPAGRLADQRCHAGAVGPAVHHPDRRGLEWGQQHRVRSAEHQPGWQLRVGRRPQDVHEQRLLCRASRYKQPAADPESGRRQRTAQLGAQRRILEHRPRAFQADRHRWHDAPDRSRRRVQRAESG